MFYNPFKLQWMIDHGFTLANLIAEIDEYRKDFPQDTPLMEVFKKWELNSGFGGRLWPCYNEAAADEEYIEED